MKKNFYLVRHGEKVKKIGDPPLSEKGVQQAKLTGTYFQTIPVDNIFTSPILRSKETAKYISEILGISYEVNKLLKERVNWGDDPDQSFQNFVAMWKRASEERSWQPPVGDSSVNAGKRMEKVIQSLLFGNNSNFILVTHGGIICDYLRNVFPDEVLKKYSKDNPIFDDAIFECSITTVEYDTVKKKFNLIGIASTEHLENL